MDKMKIMVLLGTGFGPGDMKFQAKDLSDNYGKNSIPKRSMQGRKSKGLKSQDFSPLCSSGRT